MPKLYCHNLWLASSLITWLITRTFSRISEYIFAIKSSFSWMFAANVPIKWFRSLARPCASLRLLLVNGSKLCLNPRTSRLEVLKLNRKSGSILVELVFEYVFEFGFGIEFIDSVFDQYNAVLVALNDVVFYQFTWRSQLILGSLDFFTDTQYWNIEVVDPYWDMSTYLVA